MSRDCSKCGAETDDEGVCMNLECFAFGRFMADARPGHEWPGQTVVDG